MTHFEFIQGLIPAVRHHGAAATLDRLVAEGHHATLASFYVWAVDRLVAAGLDDRQVMWHPLVDRNSPSAWYTPELLASEAARTGFVVADKALASEPQPHVVALAVR
jgi:hypothetical protein